MCLLLAITTEHSPSADRVVVELQEKDGSDQVYVISGEEGSKKKKAARAKKGGTK